jgi:hypothetical protein
MPDDMDRATPETALLTARVLWALLLVGQLAFLLTIFSVRARGAMPNVAPDGKRLVAYLAIGGLVLLLPLGYHLRNQAYKKEWRGDTITPRGYVTGNLILFVLCQMACTLALTWALVSGAFWPAALPAVVAAAVYAVNFPNGQAMLPAPPA